MWGKKFLTVAVSLVQAPRKRSVGLALPLLLLVGVGLGLLHYSGRLDAVLHPPAAHTHTCTEGCLH